MNNYKCGKYWTEIVNVQILWDLITVICQVFKDVILTVTLLRVPNNHPLPRFHLRGNQGLSRL